eukprot:4281886-Pleurochrysis_carterae.AAC.1
MHTLACTEKQVHSRTLLRAWSSAVEARNPPYGGVTKPSAKIRAVASTKMSPRHGGGAERVVEVAMVVEVAVAVVAVAVVAVVVLVVAVAAVAVV